MVNRNPWSGSTFGTSLLLAVALSAAAVSDATASEVSDAAYPLLAARVTAVRTSFPVYQDADSGLNHGIPSGLFTQAGGDPAVMIDLETSCLDDPGDPTDCSSDFSRLDRERGTVVRIIFTFDPDVPFEFAGVNFEEPENWGANPRGIGYDLRGSQNLVLDARSPDGISVRFGVHGNTSAFLPIPAAWTTFTTPLSTLGIPDLSNVHLVFTVVTNDGAVPTGGTIFLDNVRFEPAPIAQSSALGFPLGTETFGVVPLDTPDPGCVPLPADQILRNLTTIYESALVVLALLDRGLPADLDAARLIADTLHHALHHDNQGDLLPLAPDGSTGLHSGYSSGDVALLNSQGPGAGQAGEVRLAGFSAGTTLCGSTAFCLLLDGATGGNVAFAMLALLAAYEEFGDDAYLEDARTLGRWVVGNLTDPTGTGFGGYYLGYPDEGVPPPKPLILGKSIENNADVFVAFRQLAAVERALGNDADADLWTARADVAGDFVMEMFDAATGCFSAGTVPSGTPPDPDHGIDPSGEARGDDVINVFPFLDANTFTTLALAKDPRYRNLIDWREAARCVLDRFAKSASVGSGPDLIELSGFSLVESPVCGADGIAWEFTGQAVVTMRFVDRLYGETDFEPEAQLYLGQLRQAQLSAPFGDGAGVVAATLQDGDALAPIAQCLNTPFQCIPERVGLAATTWAIFADRDLNPLLPPCTPDLVLENQTVNSVAVFEACSSIAVGPDFAVGAAGDLVLRAGSEVVLRNGFLVETGGKLSVEIDPSI